MLMRSIRAAAATSRTGDSRRGGGGRTASSVFSTPLVSVAYLRSFNKRRPVVGLAERISIRRSHINNNSIQLEAAVINCTANVVPG